MKASEYIEKSIKKLKCPSGLEVTVKKITTFDYLKHGYSPDVLQGYSEDSVKKKKLSKEQMQIANDLQKMFLTSCVLPTQDLIVVDKDLVNCKENELPISLLSDEDINYLITEISKFSFGEPLKEGEFRETGEEPLVDHS